MRVTVLTHRRASETSDALEELLRCAREAGATLRLDPEETAKHELEPQEGLELDAPIDREADLCVVLGGDGTILAALRAYAGTGVPVFAVNFGQVGFLATLDPDGRAGAFERAFSGDYEVLELPAIRVQEHVAFNDVSVHRKPGGRVADMAYQVGREEIGRVRCDGLVVSTPAGSTGYNLANGGPVMAWGVRGYVVSFIAPHSLTARSLVVGPRDVLTLVNESRDEAVEIHVDGRPALELDPGQELDVAFEPGLGSLAQLPGASFYHRLSERFGRLAR